MLWLDADGETHELASQEAFARFVDHEWCSLPWVLHLCEGSEQSLQSLTLPDRAKGLFVHYDINVSQARVRHVEHRRLKLVQAHTPTLESRPPQNDGRIDRAEMRRMIKDINLEDLRVSDALLDRFVRSE